MELQALSEVSLEAAGSPKLPVTDLLIIDCLSKH